MSNFQTTLECAAAQARFGGKISDLQYLQLRHRINFDPIFVAQAETLATEQVGHIGMSPPVVVAEGASVGTVGTINWANLIAFVQTIVPLIVQLMALFNPPAPATK